MKKQLIVTVLLFMAIVTGSLYAQTANLSIQGVLRNSNGTAVENDYYLLTFKLYTSANGGSAIWTEVMDSVEVNGGIYSVVLGEASSPGLNVPFDQPYYLGVAVEGGTELIPRTILTSSPYALSLIGNDNIFPNSGNVGVGDGSPNTKLSVKRGNAVLGLDADENANLTTRISTESDGLTFHTDGTNTAHIFTGTNGVGNIIEMMRVGTNGNVGIGEIDPQNKLHVKGDNEQIRVEGINNANIGLYRTTNSTTNGASLGFSNANGSDLALKNSIGDIRFDPENSVLVGGQLNIEDNAEVLSLKGNTHAYLGFYPQSGTTRKGYFGFAAANGSVIRIQNETNDGDVTIATKNSGGGDININPGSGGEVYVNGMLNLEGSKVITQNWFTYIKEPNPGTTSNWGGYNQGSTSNKNYSLSCENFIRGAGFHTHSDKRIKKDLKASNSNSDLKTLNNIVVTDYRHIDELEHGTSYTKGFIAQQIKEVFPEAVSIGTKVIPNILAIPTNTVLQKNTLQLTLDKKHNLKVGDKVKLITKVGEQMKVVTNIKDDFSFSINANDIDYQDELVVYGKEINDFHVVDYNKIYTLSVSATQELSHKIEALEKENQQLRASTSAATNLNVAIKADYNDLAERMIMLENILGATGNK